MLLENPFKQFEFLENQDREGFLLIIFLRSVIHLLIFVGVVIHDYFSICLSSLRSLSVWSPVMSVMNSYDHRSWARACRAV